MLANRGASSQCAMGVFGTFSLNRAQSHDGDKTPALEVCVNAAEGAAPCFLKGLARAQSSAAALASCVGHLGILLEDATSSPKEGVHEGAYDAFCTHTVCCVLWV